MKRNVIFWLAVTAAVMVGLPWLAVSFVRGTGDLRCVSFCFLA